MVSNFASKFKKNPSKKDLKKFLIFLNKVIQSTHKSDLHFNTNNNLQFFPQKDHKNAPHVVISRSHAGNVAKLAKKAFGPETTVSEAAGAGYKVMAVVNGTYDVYLHATAIKKWDLCAGDAMIRTVEGKMTTTKGKDIDYSVNGDVKVTDGLLVTRFDHAYYLSKLPDLSVVP